MREWRGSCQRCGKGTSAYIMSMHSEALICLDCKDKEEKRSDYQQAVDRDLDAFYARWPHIKRPRREK